LFAMHGVALVDSCHCLLIFAMVRLAVLYPRHDRTERID